MNSIERLNIRIENIWEILPHPGVIFKSSNNTIPYIFSYYDYIYISNDKVCFGNKNQDTVVLVIRSKFSVKNKTMILNNIKYLIWTFDITDDVEKNSNVGFRVGDRYVLVSQLFLNDIAWGKSI